MTNDELPEGWVQAPLSDVVDVLDSKRIPLNSDEREQRIRGKRQSDLVPYYGATGQVGFVDEPLFNEPLILLGEDGVPFLDPLKHKAYRVSGKTWVNNHAHVLRARSSASDERFITGFLNSFDYTGYVTGSTRLKLTQGSMNSIPVRLAPLAEQKRIADKLEAVLGRVDACLARLNRVPDLLKRFRQSVLAAATSGQLTEDWREANEGAEWQKRKLTELGELGRGKSRHRPRNDPRLYGGTYPFIQTGDVAKAGERITTHSQTYSEFGLAQSRLWPAGTVCITIAANIADTAILGYEACFPDSVVGFVANPKECLPEFIKWTVDVIKDDLEAFAPATAQKNINLGVLYEIDLLIPPISEQVEIARRVQALFAMADRIEARLTAAQTQVERLTPATLHKAFCGGLVPQDPNDEPASKLLERLDSSSRKRLA